MLRLSRNPAEYSVDGSDLEGTCMLYLVSQESQIRLEFFIYHSSILMLVRHNDVSLGKAMLSPATNSHSFEFNGHQCMLKLVAMHLPQTIDIGVNAPREVKVIRGEIIGNYELPRATTNPNFSATSVI